MMGIVILFLICCVIIYFAVAFFALSILKLGWWTLAIFGIIMWLVLRRRNQ